MNRVVSKLIEVRFYTLELRISELKNIIPGNKASESKYQKKCEEVRAHLDLLTTTLRGLSSKDASVVSKRAGDFFIRIDFDNYPLLPFVLPGAFDELLTFVPRKRGTLNNQSKGEKNYMEFVRITEQHKIDPKLKKSALPSTYNPHGLDLKEGQLYQYQRRYCKEKVIC